ncbi:ABC transporter permease [Halomicrococcus sp. NG-SE-24]|uniref:ABC transporter permease n=1 Tax=Halomicrococcus sp. NG-SE-24 TaxID=3436928 RepID=UPI003D97758F
MSHTDDDQTFDFETVSDVQLTRKERARRLTDEYVLAPFRVLWSDYRARIGLIIIGFFLLLGTVGTMVVPEPEYHGAPKHLQPFVDMAHPLGTDHQGRGLMSQVVHATAPMLQMIIAGAVFSTFMATIIGTVSGYKGGPVDRVSMYIVDIVMTIPSLPLVIVLAATLQPKDPIVVGLVLSITAWAGLSRNIRSQVLSLREEPYIEASRTMGLSTATILAKDVTPNIMPYVMVHFVQTARNIIFASVALYFLGFLPAQSGTKNWGVMLNQAYNNGGLIAPSLYFWFAVPMVAIVLLSYGLIMLGQGTDRIFNPRIRARHAKTVDDDDETNINS